MEWYRHAEEYDQWFSWDPTKERDFILAASQRWGIAEPKRILEPMCGPGRLLRAMPGWVVGLDLTPEMTRVAAKSNPVIRADAARFAFSEGSFDLAFNLIDSFRHLRDEESAFNHLRCVAHSLRPGAVYVLGFDINGHLPADVARDEWASEREGTKIRGFVEGLGDPDVDARVETIRVVYEVNGQTRDFVHTMRTYTPRQVEDLIDAEASFEIEAVSDRGYDLDTPIDISEATGSAVLVLRKG